LYQSPKSGISYMFNATPDDQAGAEAACNSFGGHLALYGSLSEQQEVERALVYDGGMIGSYHKSYWVGLTQSESNAQLFTWLDRTLPSPSNRTYQHWEPGQPSSKVETCVVATWKTSYSGAWAWDDVSCYDLQFPYICKKSRGWQALPTQRPAASVAAGLPSRPAARPKLHRPRSDEHSPPAWHSAQDGPLPQHHDQQRLHDQHHARNLLHA
jgi:hypothetical protein